MVRRRHGTEPPLTKAAVEPPSSGPPSLRRGVSWLLLAEVAVRITSITTTIGVARLVGPRDLGDYLVAVSLLSYAAVLGDAGLTLYAQRQLLDGGRASTLRTDVLTAVLLVQTIASLLAIAIIVGIAQVLPISAGARQLVWMGAPLLLAQALSMLYVLQALEGMKTLAILRVLAQLSGSIGGFVAVAVTKDVAWLIVFNWAGVLAADVGCWVALRRRRIGLGRFDGKLLRRTLGNGSPFLLNALAITVLLNADVFVVGMVSGSSEAGEYGAGYRIALGMLTLSSVVVTSVYPRFIRLSGLKDGGFEDLLRRVVTLGLRFTLPLTVVVMIYSEVIIRLLYGSKYDAAARVLRVVFLWVPLGWLSTFASQALVAAGHHKRQIFIACTSAALLVALLCALVRPYGAVGAAWSVAIAEAATALNFLHAIRVKLGARLEGVVLQAWPYLVVPAVPLLLARVADMTAALCLAGLVAIAGMVLVERRQHESTWSLLRR